MICEILASIELASLETPTLRFIPWSEIRDRSPKREAPDLVAGAPRPDGIIGLEYAGAAPRYRFFAIEADRGSMPVCRTGASQSSIQGKLAAYRSAYSQDWHRTALGIPNLIVLIVTLDHRRAQRILQLTAEGGAGDRRFSYRHCRSGEL